MMTAAIAIGPADQASPESPRLSELTMAEATIENSREGDPHPGGVADNPNIGLLDLVVAIHRGQGGIVGLDHGAGRGYSIRLTKGALPDRAEATG